MPVKADGRAAARKLTSALHKHWDDDDGGVRMDDDYDDEIVHAENKQFAARSTVVGNTSCTIGSVLEREHLQHET